MTEPAILEAESLQKGGTYRVTAAVPIMPKVYVSNTTAGVWQDLKKVVMLQAGGTFFILGITLKKNVTYVYEAPGKIPIMRKDQKRLTMKVKGVVYRRRKIVRRTPFYRVDSDAGRGFVNSVALTGKLAP